MSSTPEVQLEVVGNPIKHSWSPQIHQDFASQFARNISYEKTEVALDAFAQHAETFFNLGGLGMNVEVPFKEDAYRFASVLSPGAKLAGAVNTLHQIDGQVYGYNTDGVGLVNDLTHRFGCALAGRRVLVLGAGGSAKGLLTPLVQAQVAEIVWANRTPEKAHELAATTRAAGVASRGVGLPVTRAVVGDEINLIINTTSVGLQGAAELNKLCAPTLIAGRICYDLSYGANARFQQWTAQHGAAQSLDGLGMLVEQAAQSFFHWFGERPVTEPIYQRLRTTHFPT